MTIFHSLTFNAIAVLKSLVVVVVFGIRKIQILPEKAINNVDFKGGY